MQTKKEGIKTRATKISETAKELTIKLVFVRNRCLVAIKYITIPFPNAPSIATIVILTLNQVGKSGRLGGIPVEFVPFIVVGELVNLVVSIPEPAKYSAFILRNRLQICL